MTLDDENEATLLIRSIQPDNAGVYECIVSNPVGDEVSVEMVVDVQSEWDLMVDILESRVKIGWIHLTLNFSNK